MKGIQITNVKMSRNKGIFNPISKIESEYHKINQRSQTIFLCLLFSRTCMHLYSRRVVFRICKLLQLPFDNQLKGQCIIFNNKLRD